MKHLRHKVLCLLIAVFLAMPMTAFAAGGTFSMSASTGSVNPGKTFTVSVGGACCGRVDLSVSNGTLSESKVWVEDGMSTVSVTAGQSGSVTVTAVPYEGFSDLDAELYEPGSRSVTVKINAPKEEPKEDDDDKDDSKEEDKKPAKKPTSSGSDKNTSDDSSSDNSVGSSNDNDQSDDQDKEDKADKDDKDKDKDKDKNKDKDKDKEPVKEDEEKEPVKEKRDWGCIMHWICLLAAVAGAALIYVWKADDKKQLAVLGAYLVVAVVLAIAGSCHLDWIFAFGGTVVLGGEYIFLSKKNQ